VNKKYLLTSKLLHTTYDKLFGNNTLLGKWLRSKSTIIKINDNIFVHAGISEQFLKQDFDLETSNNMMRQSLLVENNTVENDSIYQKYYENSGPIWYRGYFRGNLKNKSIKTILKSLKAKHIIVGHTSQHKIESLYKKKILAVDSSIKNGVYGEILFIEHGKYYRGTMGGRKIKLK
jgi:AAA+ ATPase superfamily predicted ATPase